MISMVKRKRSPKWYSKKREDASKRNIKKAQHAWDEMAYSTREGNIPKTQIVKGTRYSLAKVALNKGQALKSKKQFMANHRKSVIKPMTIGGTSYHGKFIPKHDVYPVYASGKRKKFRKPYTRKSGEHVRRAELY